ncbi:sulfatase [Stieleria sp. JC731]|uniref:sulfatase n=1 Tax=Pirellulaceae TaxID=2691357 RepID=UPI001E2DFCF8|nr:sulfatase [Stieleria sp. JC731]MCC9602466.1 sulfatase [Stieleria sp. JC731]
MHSFQRVSGVLLCVLLCSHVSFSQDRPPNVLMIAIDDLNDWIEPLGGHPQVQTPAMNRLASRGVTFTNAHCQAPLCNPSRTSIMTGRRPSTTGVYGLSPWIRNVDELRDLVTMPQHFAANGYKTFLGGKIHHGGYGRRKNPKSEADVWGPPAKVGARPAEKLIGETPGGNNPLMDWGTFPHRDEDKGDWEVASWAVNQLDELGKQQDQPFFLAAGFFLPHVPCYVTQKWYDMYPEESLVLPPILAGDRNDTPESSWYIHWYLPEPRTSWLVENDQLKNLTRSYLASVSFVDSQVGRILDALDQSGLADSTIVVLWSDHGYHLGEKAISGKNSLWRHSTRVPLIISVPDGLANIDVAAGSKCRQPAELLDLYPTLSQLAGLPIPAGQEGQSLVPQLANVDQLRERPAICTHNAGNHSVCDTAWRYIVYADGAQELYDLAKDPWEQHNLIGSAGILPVHQATVDRLSAYLPTEESQLAPGSAHRILEKREDGFYWEEKKIVPEDAMK